MATTASNQHRCVFVGNIPYDTSEEQLIEICSEVGPVVSFRLVLDRETGKPKGYGFCEYKDEETALSARRNLQGYEINGRQLRVDFAENDKGVDRSRDQGRGAPGSTSTNYAQKALPRPPLPTDSSVNQPIGHSLAATAASHMARSLGGPQTSGLVMQNGLQNNMGLGNDPLTYYLANMSRQQINEIMAELKTLVVRNKPLAQQLLQECPQLLKAIFQAQIMLGMVPPHMMQTANTRPSSSSIPQSNIQNNLQTQNQLPPPYPIPNPTIPPQPSIPVQNTSVQSPFQPPNRPGITIMPPAHGSLPPQIPPLQVPPPNNQTFGPPMATSAGIYSHPPIQNSHPPPIQNSHPPPIQNSHQHSYLPPPPMTSQAFQTGPSNCPPLPIGPNAPSNDVGSYASTSHETFDSINNQSKRQKLEAISNFPINSSIPPQPKSINPIPGDETSSVQPSESQNPQIQLPEVELTLLQQVMKITPEQLSSLPLEQQQQVIQLQQMLAKQNL